MGMLRFTFEASHLYDREIHTISGVCGNISPEMQPEAVHSAQEHSIKHEW